MVDDDEKKEDLDKGILMKAINALGGKSFWAFIFIKSVIMSLWAKYTDY